MEPFINYILGLPPYIYIPILSIIGFLAIIRIIKVDFYNAENRDETFWEYLTCTFWRFAKRKKTIDKKLVKAVKKNTYSMSDNDRDERKKELLLNDFFVSCNKYISSDIPSLNFGDEKRNEVLRKMLIILVETMMDCAKNVIKNTDFDKLETGEIMESFNKAMFNYDSKIRKNLISYMGEDLYVLLYESPNGFKEKTRASRVFMMDAINTFPRQSSKRIKDNYEKVENVLSIMDSALHYAVINYENVFRSFNGQLTQLLKNK